MITGPKTVLVVDDDPTVRRVLREGLPAHLSGSEIATAVHGGDAIQHLSMHPVDAIVTDVSMPIMDGFALLAYVRKHHPNMPVVVLSAMAPEQVAEEAPALGLLRILRKPAAPLAVARAVTEARAETVRGRVTGVPLAGLLYLVQLERKSCSLLVRSGTRKGRLHFLSGELVNAYSFELGTDGVAAARQVLSWDPVTVDFERSLHNHQRLIDAPLQALLLEIATARDERQRQAMGDAPGPHDDDRSMAQGPDAHAPPQTGEVAPLTPPEPPADELTATSTEPVPEPVRLAEAAATLHRQLTTLRARCETTSATVVAVQPVLERVQSALAQVAQRPSPGYDEAAVEASLRELAAVAERLAQAAAALAVEPAPAPRADTSL